MDKQPTKEQDKELISQDEKILTALAIMGCRNVNPDNPSRVAMSITSLYDVLKASEKFIHDFDELMIGAGKAKKEGILHPTDLVHKVEKLISELHMYTTLARSKIGTWEDKPPVIDYNTSSEV